MKLSMTLFAVTFLLGTVGIAPSLAKDATADLQKDEAKATAEQNKANAEVAKGHTFRAGRAAKKAEKAAEKVQADQK